jgi:hypothetical protein
MERKSKVDLISADEFKNLIENSTSINSDYCISTGSNATSAGQLTISNGVTITVPNGSTWSIV